MKGFGGPAGAGVAALAAKGTGMFAHAESNASVATAARAGSARKRVKISPCIRQCVEIPRKKAPMQPLGAGRYCP
jgi:hypothetical protein